MTDKVNILHLSDIHFGVEPDGKIGSTPIAQRENTLNGLFEALKNINPQWKPNVIVISGDIGWKGIKTDYEQAKKWLKRLLDSLSLAPNELIFCAGNHDIDREKTAGMSYPISADQSDNWLKIEKLKNFIKLFKDYNAFCEEFKLPQLKIGENLFYLIGQRKIKGLRFVVLNSSWFCRGDDDRNNLWIGLPQLEVMNASDQLVDPDKYDNDTITVTVLHHPQYSLNEAEYNSYNERINTYKYLSERCHIILSGHSEGAIDRPSKISNRAYLFTGGATYSGNNYRNNFSIIQINKNNRTAIRNLFEFVPNESKWKSSIDKEEYYLRLKSIRSDESAFTKVDTTSYNYCSLAEKARNHALLYIEQKSRAIARTINLPRLIERKVAVHNREERVKVTGDDKLELNTKNNIAPLAEMVSVGRPIFLFGELGSGKSTIVGDFVIKLSDKIDGLIPILIPAKFFLNKNIDTFKSFSCQISEYINAQIDPSNNTFDLKTALIDRQEITLVIDGFDELDRNAAQQLLMRAEETISHWSGLRVIATGRPIELKGLDYSRWQCLEMMPLSNDEQEQLLINEALADGMDKKASKEDAKERFKFLQRMPELLSIATTPLTIRLMRPYLTDKGSKKSLGDLLYKISQERLGEWGEREGKEECFKDFKAFFPDSFSREKILGKIAAAIYNSQEKYINSDSLHTIIETEVSNVSNKGAVVAQGCDFFKKNILQQDGEFLTFPSQPLFQFALGYYIVDKLKKDEKIQLAGESKTLWREYSFAAAIARRKDLIQKLRPYFESYIKSLQEWKSPAVAMVISESGDTTLADLFIKSLQECDFRPLKIFSDNETLSFAVFAHCIYLAEEKGFGWFYEEYLNPRYPLLNFEGRFAANIFKHWLLISDCNLTLEQKEKLSTITKPHIAARSSQTFKLLPMVSLAYPDIFASDELALLLADNLNSPMFGEKAVQFLRKEYNTGNKNSVLRALEIVCSKRENGHTTAAKLWLEFNKDKPPLSIINSIIAGTIKRKDRYYLLEELENRIKKDNLNSILRWYLFKDSKIATAAALLLFKEGERNLYLLGNGLLKGLHDVGTVLDAENVLQSLIHENGKKGLFWFVNQFPNVAGLYGAHSAQWRILLKELNHVDSLHKNLFLFAIGYLGEFTIPRHPEIRREFQILLTKKPEYRKTLKEALFSLDNNIRYNAACILLTCFPKDEIKAAEVAINATPITFHRHEWNNFCLRLSLGVKILNHLASILDRLHEEPKTFALALLYHNNYRLTDEQYRMLITGLLGQNSSLDYDFPPSEKILAQDKAFALLLGTLNSNNMSLAKGAAENLMNYHRSKLTNAQIATCLILTIDRMGWWNLTKLEEESDLILHNKEFVEQVRNISQDLQVSTSQEPLASIYIRTFSDNSAWKDLVWAGMFQEVVDSDIEQSFIWLYKKGRKNKSIAELIGKAAIDFLEHSTIKAEKTYNSRIPWLTMLAHEFNDIPKDKLELIILEYRPIDDIITSALIARLGYVPKRYKPSRDCGYITLFTKYNRINIESIEFERAVDILRDTGEIHDEFVMLIENTLLSGTITTEKINELALKSKFGALFASIIFFCQGALKNYKWLISTIGMTISNQHPPKQLATIVANASRTIRKIIAEDNTAKDEYFSYIEQTIEEQNHPNIILLYQELLEHKGSLKDRLIPKFFSELLLHKYYLNRPLAEMLVDYFAHDVKKENRPFILSEVKKIISVISSEIEKYRSFEKGCMEWIFSLAAFYLQGSVDDESERVFLHALQSIFIHKYDIYGQPRQNEKHFNAQEILQIVNPLIEKVPRNILYQVIEKGVGSDILEVRSFCKILSALTRK